MAAQPQDYELRLEAVESMTQELREELTQFKNDIGIKIDTIAAFVTGANRFLGFTRKNWKTALTFGAGVMSAAGIGNPRVWDFISGFHW